MQTFCVTDVAESTKTSRVFGSTFQKYLSATQRNKVRGYRMLRGIFPKIADYHFYKLRLQELFAAPVETNGGDSAFASITARAPERRWGTSAAPGKVLLARDNQRMSRDENFARRLSEQTFADGPPLQQLS